MTQFNMKIKSLIKDINKRLILSLSLLFTTIGYIVGEEVHATIAFGNDGIKITNALLERYDSQNNKWIISTTGTKTFISTTSYSQVGSSTYPAQSITFQTTLLHEQMITSLHVKLGGFNGTNGDVTLKVDNEIVGEGNLNATNDVIITNNAFIKGKTLSITINGIANGIKCYNISYSYDNTEEYSRRITLSTNGIKTEVKTNEVYILPTQLSTDLTGAKVFVGWTTNPTLETNEKPQSDFYEKGEIVNIIGGETYYAVFANPITNIETETFITGGDLSQLSPIDFGWSNQGTGTYFNNGVKFDSKGDYIQSSNIEILGYTNLLLKFKAGYNGDLGSELTVYAYNANNELLQDNEVTINPKTTVPTDLYNQQNTIYQVDISATTIIKHIVIKMTNRISNIGMKYCELFAIPSFSGYSTLLDSDITYKVTYNDNGATGGDVPEDATKYNRGATVTVCTNSRNLTKTHYAFSHWNTKMDGTGISYEPGSTFEITDNITLYAQWSQPYTIIEWQEDGIVVMYPEEATDASISWEGSALQSVAITPIDHAVYKLTINDLSQKANQSLALRIGTKEVTYTVPYMITNGHDKIADHGDIVVLSNGSFTAQGEIVGDVTVYGGGQLVIPENQTLTLNTLTMRVGGIENGKYQHQYPQLILRGTLNNTAGHINIDYITTYDRYYALSLPYAVETTDIHYPQDIYGDLVSPSNKGSFALQYYDGYARATTGGGWMDVQEPARLNPYQGYTFWGAPKKVNIHGTTERQLFGIHRIPMRMGNEELDRNEKTDKVIAISAYEADRPNDSGWNFIGNPYLAPYQGDIGYSTEQLRYITTTTDGKNYQSIPVATASIDPLHAYFVQAGETSDLSFEQTNRVPLPLQARKEHEAREMTTGLVLYGPDHTDCMGLLIAEHYTEAYEYNADLAKFENQDINIFAIGQTGKLAYMAIHPELAKQQIPIGYSVPDRGVYTLAWDEAQHNNDDIIALYLIDKDNGQVTNLIALDYTFNSEKGANTARFALQVAFAPNNATRAIYLEERAIELTREGHTIHMTNLPLDTRVTIYNAIGHMVEQSSASYSHQWTLPTGYYLMDIRTKQSNIILNTIIP